MLPKRTKARVIGEHRMHEKDTGSARVQVGILTSQIEELTTHLRKHPKDNHSRRGLLKMVSQRRRLLRYMQKRQPAEYLKIVKKLNLKK
ncbi:MAG: 30S ribosomal protein S15 [Candidatus Liptonbacteria bacterium]|nr:30S ribosomal protein S15 [Candidatus Liptonbacteria bacterium]